MKFFRFILILFLCLCPFWVKAEQGVIVTPVIIDEQTEARGILEYNIKLKNKSDVRNDLYVIIRDVEEGGEINYKDPSELDSTKSITRWSSITRGVIEIMPDEEKEIPLTINIPKVAEPGFYHAVVIFARGSNRPDALKNASEKNEAKVLVNIEIKNNEIELAEALNFRTKKSILIKKPIEFFLEIKNNGNKNIAPKGTIDIYNKGGVIVGTVPVNEEQISIYPGEKKEINVSWNDEVANFGKFKARLNLNYGVDLKTIQDVIYFTLIPLPILILLIFLVLVLVAVMSFLLIRKNIVKDEEIETSTINEDKIIYNKQAEFQKQKQKREYPDSYTIDLKSRRQK